MTYRIDELYRHRKMAQMVDFTESALDVGCAQYPNVFLRNKIVVGVDLDDSIMPSNYTNFIRGDLRTVAESTADHVMLFPQRWLIRMLELTGFVDVHLYSGGVPIPGIGLLPCPRFLCYQTVAVAKKV